MAILKERTLPNGIVVTYHRIASMFIDINSFCRVSVYSYVSQDSRNILKKYSDQELEENGMVFPYEKVQYFNLPYQENLSIKEAYEYLKTLPEFEDATDV